MIDREAVAIGANAGVNCAGGVGAAARGEERSGGAKSRSGSLLYCLITEVDSRRDLSSVLALRGGFQPVRVHRSGLREEGSCNA